MENVKVRTVVWSSTVCECHCNTSVHASKMRCSHTCEKGRMLKQGRMRVTVLACCGTCGYCAKAVRRNKWTEAMMPLGTTYHTQIDGWCLTTLCAISHRVGKECNGESSKSGFDVCD